jgi:long-subunit acyl-CoA synthetase (AMP-forming)/GNAT superfamily N-acetyltransferase
MHREHLSGLHTVVALDTAAATDRGVVPFERVVEKGVEVSRDALAERRDRLRIDGLATVMYTSGTTGTPKGIMFSHRNIVFKRYARAMALPQIGEEDRFLCYLPLFHTFGRFLELAACVFWGAIYCFAENPSIETLIRQMQRFKPTVFISIPMKWMQLYEQICQTVDVDVADDQAILEATRRTTGGQLRWGLSAAGYLDPDIFRFFQRQGIELMSGFGMTEATGGITMTPPGQYMEHSLGRALPGIELSLAEDGELMVRGPYVMIGYLNPPEHEPSVDENGWLHTGDIMEMDEKGFIQLVDRKKEIYKNIKGQTIAPQRIENLFRDFDSVGRIFLVGDHRSYNTALIYPNSEFQELDLKSLSREELKAHFRSLVVSANSFVDPYERIVDFAVIDRDFDATRGELTPKGTYRRKVIERNFADVIEPLYRRTTLAVGGTKAMVPNWFFQKMGVTTEDLQADEEFLILNSTGTRLKVRQVSDREVQVGSVLYHHGRGPLDLGLLLRTPSLWLGNEDLVQFAPLDLRLRHRRREIPEDLEWVGRLGVYEPPQTERRDLEALLAKNDLDLMDMHLVATHLESADSTDAVCAVRVLEHVLGLNDGRMVEISRRILRRAKYSTHPEVLRRAFQILTQAEQPQVFRDTLSAFLDSPIPLLDPETVAVLAERDIGPERLDAFIAEANQRSLGSADSDTARESAKSLLDFLSEYGTIHPSCYGRLRGFLTRVSKQASSSEVRVYARQVVDRLEQGFRGWLGVTSRVAVDPETGREYRWDDVVDFAEDVDDEARKRMLEAFKSTPVLREAVFLFYGATISLENILPNGLWVRLLGTDHGKSVYRVAVRTRHRGHFDLAINLNRALGSARVREEIDWLIMCSEPGDRGSFVETFGGYWPQQDLWSEEFIAGETLGRALRRISRQPHYEERYLTIWPYLAWSALSAYVDLWNRTGESNPDPNNVVVPMHDYHTGARLVSISGRRPFDSVYQLLRAMRQEFVIPMEQEHPRLAGQVGWDIIFSAVVEVVGEEDSGELLRNALREANSERNEEFGSAVERFLGSVEERGFLPMRLFFAAKRYRRWAKINPDATVPARAATLQEIYQTYNLSNLQAEYPEVRARFFQDTVFRNAEPPLAEGLERIIGKLRTREIAPDNLSFAIADLRARLKLGSDVDYFLARLSFPYLRPEDEAAFVPAESGGTFQSEMVVTLEDTEGYPYRIRHALSAKEVGRLHSLFLAARLAVQFRPDHRFLVAVNERGNLIGGLFYEMDPEARTAHMDKVVVADRFQRKGVAGALLEELCNRLKTEGYRSLTTGFFRPQFFYRYGFTVERRYAGLVRSLEEREQESKE